MSRPRDFGGRKRLGVRRERSLSGGVGGGLERVWVRTDSVVVEWGWGWR